MSDVKFAVAADERPRHILAWLAGAEGYFEYSAEGLLWRLFVGMPLPPWVCSHQCKKLTVVVDSLQNGQ